MVAPLLLGLIPAISSLLDRVIPDPQARAAAQLELLKEQNSTYLAEIQAAVTEDTSQNAINTEEAKNESVFVSGWRPFIGWTCGIALAYHFVLQPLIAFTLAQFGHNVILPTFDMSTLSTILMGMLGLGGLRTVEKVQQIKAQ